MHRRKFLSLVSGAVAAVAGGLGISAVAGPKNLLAEAAGTPAGPIVVTPVEPSDFDQARILQTIMNHESPGSILRGDGSHDGGKFLQRPGPLACNRK